MNGSRRHGKGLSRKEFDRASVRQVDLQTSLQRQKALVGPRVLVPAVLALHDRHAEAVVVDLDDHKILVRFCYSRRGALQIDSRRSEERRVGKECRL